MGRPEKSWHIPYLPTYHRADPHEIVDVIFLQRLSKNEQTQILECLEVTDEKWLETLDVQAPALRRLVARSWIRDYWPSSEVILEIAKAAYSSEGYSNKSYTSLILCDSGWEAGNVIVARWEKTDPANEPRLVATRVPMNIANALSTVCDSHEGFTLSRALGEEIFEDAKVDLYASHQTAGGFITDRSHSLPSFLPEDLKPSRTEPLIISLRILDDEAIASLRSRIIEGDDSHSFRSLKIFNWQGAQPTRETIYSIIYCLRQNSPQDYSRPFFLIDYLLEGENGEPQILAAKMNSPRTELFDFAQLVAVRPHEVLPYWKEVPSDSRRLRQEEFGDLLRQEEIHSFGSKVDFDAMQSAMVFFLHPFTLTEERIVRQALSTLGKLDDPSWGKEYIYHGYLWPERNTEHSLEDLRDLFERHEPFSPQYSPDVPHQFINYPHHFIAVDRQVLSSEPKVWVCSSLDFHGEETADDLGWLYGTMEAKEAYITWQNLDIANMGPGDFFDKPQKLWLTDLKAYRERDFDMEREE